MEASTIVHMSASGEVSIPSEVREVLDWRGAMELSIRLTDSGLLIQSTEAMPRTCGRRLEELRGILKHDGVGLGDDELFAPVDSAGDT